MKIKMWYGGNIYFNNYCAYLDKVELKVQKEYSLTYDIKFWLEKNEYEIEFDNCLFLNKGETTWIKYLEGMKIAVSTGYKNIVYITAVVDIQEAENFEWFDNIIKFERFYKKLKDYVINLVKELEEEYE